jgi:hypothetical protein
MYEDNVLGSINVIFAIDKNDEFNLVNGLISVGNTPELDVLEKYIKEMKTTKLSISNYKKVYVSRTLIKNKQFLKDILSSNVVSYYYKFMDDEFVLCKLQMDKKDIMLCEDGNDTDNLIEIDLPIYLSE